MPSSEFANSDLERLQPRRSNPACILPWHSHATLGMLACLSGQQGLDHVPMNIGQPEIAALVVIRQAFMVDAEAAEDGGVEIVNVDSVLNDVVSVVVGLPMDDSRSHAAASHPHREAAAVVVATIVGLHRTLAVDRAPEFAAPDHQCFIQQPTLFQVGNQRRLRLVNVVALLRDV